MPSAALIAPAASAGSGDRCEIHEPDLGEVRPYHRRDLERHPRLADPTRADQRDQPGPGVAQERGQRLDLGLPAHQRCRRRWQAARPAVGRGGVGRGEATGAIGWAAVRHTLRGRRLSW